MEANRGTKRLDLASCSALITLNSRLEENSAWMNDDDGTLVSQAPRRLVCRMALSEEGLEKNVCLIVSASLTLVT